MYANLLDINIDYEADFYQAIKVCFIVFWKSIQFSFGNVFHDFLQLMYVLPGGFIEVLCCQDIANTN